VNATNAIIARLILFAVAQKAASSAPQYFSISKWRKEEEQEGEGEEEEEEEVEEEEEEEGDEDD
jgi:ribosomal protein L12E/L44/L45/RPP1/RPP2